MLCIIVLYILYAVYYIYCMLCIIYTVCCVLYILYAVQHTIIYIYILDKHLLISVLHNILNLCRGIRLDS